MKLANYSENYQNLRLRREDGILEIRLHTDDGPVKYGRSVLTELRRVFLDVAQDRENHVVILTGTGNQFCGPAVEAVRPDGTVGHKTPNFTTPVFWDELHWEAKQILTNLLDIEVPMISAVNGPAVRRADIPLLCDIVLVAEEASFQDSAHFAAGGVPGDGVHVVFPLLMGLNRGRYFLLTGQTLSAREALDFGLANEILPQAQLLPRAWELARQLMLRPTLVRRYARILLTQDLKRRMHDLLGYGLALEALGDPRLHHQPDLGER